MNPLHFSITESPSLAERTTMGVGGEAIAEVKILNTAGIDALPSLITRLGGITGFLGGGSNLLVHDGKLPLVVVTLHTDDPVRVVGEKGNSVLLRAGAQTMLPVFAAKAAGLGLSGLENLSGIPGTLGGALFMNAGSFGTQTGELLHEAEVFSPLLGLVTLPREAFDFSYRKCVLKEHRGWFCIISATLELQKGDKSAIKAGMREIMDRKRASQPVHARSAGCVFKNPSPDLPAGRLLEEAGMRGTRLGNMMFSEMHANFLVNLGGGTFEQAWDCIETARDKVKQHSGIVLEMEVRIWP